MSKNNHILSFLIIVSVSLMFLSLVSADPPFQSGGSPDGLELQFRQTNILRQNQDQTFLVHVTNKSDGVIVLDAGCYFNLLNAQGDFIYSGFNNTPDLNDFEYGFSVAGGNFSTLDPHTATVHCNNTLRGGFSSTKLVTTPTGEEATTPRAIYYVILFLILMTVFIISVLGIINSEKVFMTAFFMGLADLILIIMFFVAGSVSSFYLEQSNFMTAFFFTGFYILMYSFPIVIIGLIIWGIYMMLTIKEINSMMEKGIPEDEAYERKVRSGMRRKF